MGYGDVELMVKESENMIKNESSSSEETSDDESSGTEQEEVRHKPVFVRKRDRLTTQEREKEERKQWMVLEEEKRRSEMRRRESLRIVETCVKEIIEDEKSGKKLKRVVDTNFQITVCLGSLWSKKELE